MEITDIEIANQILSFALFKAITVMLIILIPMILMCVQIFKLIKQEDLSYGQDGVIIILFVLLIILTILLSHNFINLGKIIFAPKVFQEEFIKKYNENNKPI